MTPPDITAIGPAVGDSVSFTCGGRTKVFVRRAEVVAVEGWRLVTKDPLGWVRRVPASTCTKVS